MATGAGGGSPAAALVARAAGAGMARRKRAAALRWSALNGALLLLFVYDLSHACPGYMSLLHYVELTLAGVLCANLLHHAWALLPATREKTLTITARQQRLLGLTDADLDSSLRVVDESDLSMNQTCVSADSSDALSLSLGSARAWRDASRHDHSPHSPHSSPHSPHNTSSPRLGAERYRDTQDEFIADSHSLSDYLRQYEERGRRAGGRAGEHAPLLAAAAPRYQLALSLKESGAAEEPADGERGAEAGAGGGGPRLWWSVDLDPARLTEFNLNLRRWLQLTVLERVVRELDALDAALAAHGLPHARLGELSVERLRALAAGAAAGGGALAALPALLPFLEPFADQRYAVQRIRELSRGGCLSAFRWRGGGAAWRGADAQPADAELLLSLLGAYLDSQLPAPPAKPFSSRHLSAAPAPPPRALAIHQLSRRPPHYAVWRPAGGAGGALLRPAAGRCNLLHCVLLLLAAAAAGERGAGALQRRLGPLGLNVLWVIGR